MSNVSFRLGTPAYDAGASAVDGAIYVSKAKKCIGLGTSSGITTLVGPPAKNITVPGNINLASYSIDSMVKSMGAGLFELVLLWKVASSSSETYKYYAQRQYFNVSSTLTGAYYFTYYGGDTIPAQTLYYYNGADATTESKAIETSVVNQSGIIQVQSNIAINYSGTYANITCCPRMILNKLATDDYYSTANAVGLNPWGT